MDLIELNDVFFRDKTRIEKNNNFSNLVKILYHFAPTEDPVFTTNQDPPLSGVIIRPFAGACTDTFNHDMKEWMMVLNDTPVTCNYGDPRTMDMQPEGGIATKDELDEVYEFQKADYPLHHPDIGFSDIVPGITMVMSMVRNCNDSLLDYADLKNCSPMEKCDLGDGLESDQRAMSLVYVRESGEVLYGYGSILFFGRGLTPLSSELALYLLSNTYLIGKRYSEEILQNSRKLHDLSSYDRMKTACVIIYEDSIKRLVKEER